jgi:serine/threonine-protein kinase HipA
MTSKLDDPKQAFVWIWLPGETDPMVAGRVQRDSEIYPFTYGRSYLSRANSLPIYTPELPLEPGTIPPIAPLPMANSLRDAAPDTWGRRVIVNRLTGLTGDKAAAIELDELRFLLESGSDRIGALDFQASSTEYIPRQLQNATLSELSESADRVEQGVPLRPELAIALQHGTAVGGARPKALIDSNDRKFIAKFSSSTDTYDVVKSEFMAMKLGKYLGLDFAEVELTQAMNREVLLIERFDRIREEAGYSRRSMISALTLLGLHELFAAHASYADLAEIIRQRFDRPKETLRELFARLTLNILVGNTDDHARNQAAFWNGTSLSLTPAYDVCPQARLGREASQGMLISDHTRRSQLKHCVDAANHFLLRQDEAIELIKKQIEALADQWDSLCRDADLSEVGKALLWRRQFLNPLSVEGLEDELEPVMRNL